MTIVSGIEERANGTLYNSAVIVDGRGSVAIHHRKIGVGDLVAGITLA